MLKYQNGDCLNDLKNNGYDYDRIVLEMYAKYSRIESVLQISFSGL